MSKYSWIQLFLLVCFFQVYAKTIYITLPESFLVDPHAERDERSKHFCDLSKALSVLGYGVKSLQIPEVPEDDYEYIIFINPPEPYLYDYMKQYSRQKCICTTWEPPTVRPDYYTNDLSGYFLYNLVMFDDLVDNNYFLKFFYPQPSLKMQCSEKTFEQKKLCCLIAKHWVSKYSYELYSKRADVVLFFNNNYPQDFDLYGSRWPEWLAVYKGSLADKKTALHNYRFCICYENTQYLKGYITEKIFDCFVAGCVPVYWGAGNIMDYIPKNCFIDRRDFASNEELYSFLKSMERVMYEEYLHNIATYLKSEKAFLFSSEYFVDTILSLICPNYKKELVFDEQQIDLLAKVRAFYESFHKFSINPHSPA